jgi:hypothetical protein
LIADTCGPQAVPVLRSVVFHARIAVRGDEATWTVDESGASAVGGYVAATNGFRFGQDAQEVRRAYDRVTGRPACVLRRLDVIDGQLSGSLAIAADAGADGANERGDDGGAGGDAGAVSDAATDGGAAAPSFTAVETVVYGGLAGTDCSDQVGAGDGQFLTLPCQQVFSLRGEPVAPTP